MNFKRIYNLFMPWFFYAILSIVFFAAMNILQRIIAVDSKNPHATAVIYNFFGASVAFIIFLFTNNLKTFSLPTDSKAWIFLALGAIAYGLFERGRFHAAKHLESSVLTTVFNISAVVSFLTSAVIYREAITPNKIIGGLLVLLALFLVTFRKKGAAKKISTYGLLVGVLTCVACGFGIALDKMGAQYFSPALYSTLMWSLPIAIVCFPGIPLAEVKLDLAHNWQKTLLLAVINVLGYIFQLKAFELTEATLVIPVLQMTSLVTVLAGVVILKENDHVLRKIAAAIVAMCGVYLLV